ncbi:MAG: transposase, partial [Rhodothermaceae bacterium]|nr:transposase [Rhodothermaceae bacterium]
RKLNCADQSFNKKSNRTRARVEHTFGVIKHLWGYRRTRYRGLAKNAAQVYTLAALANFYLARDSLLTVAIAE